MKSTNQDEFVPTPKLEELVGQVRSGAADYTHAEVLRRVAEELTLTRDALYQWGEEWWPLVELLPETARRNSRVLNEVKLRIEGMDARAARLDEIAQDLAVYFSPAIAGRQAEAVLR